MSSRGQTAFQRRRGRRPDAERISGRLRAQDLKQLVADFREARLGQVALHREAAMRGSQVSALLAREGAYWWHFYDLTFPQHLALMCMGLGWGDKLMEIAKRPNPTRAFLEFASRDDPNEANPFESMHDKDRAVFLNLLFGVFYSMEAVCYYGLTVHELLDRASKGDATALLWAVSIDRCVLCSGKAAGLLADRQLRKDKAFFSGMFKRIKSPHAGRKQYVELRYLRRVMLEAGTLTGTRKEDLTDLVAGLGINHPRGADPVKSLTALFDAWGQESTRRI